MIINLLAIWIPALGIVFLGVLKLTTLDRRFHSGSLDFPVIMQLSADLRSNSPRTRRRR